MYLPADVGRCSEEPGSGVVRFTVDGVTVACEKEVHLNVERLQTKWRGFV